MNIYTQKLTNFSIGDDSVYSLVGDVVSAYGKKVVIIGGKTALEKAMPVLEKEIEKAELEVTDIIVYGKECTMANSEKIAQLDAVQQADMIFAVGGGKAIDSVKIIHGVTQIPFFTFPTIASTCAAYTEVAAVYREDHSFDGAYYSGDPAVHTFINSRIIAEAPEKYIWAGMGDTLAKYYESNFSARNKEVPYNVTSGCLFSGMCVEPLIKYGPEAYEAAKNKEVTEAFTQVVLAVIVGTGLAAVMLPEDYNSNAAHAVCYGLTTFPEIEAHALHGEMVAYGVLILLTLDNQIDERDRLIPLYDALGLPKNLKHFGLTLHDIDGLLEKAVSTRDTKVSPYEITKESIYQAIEELEQCSC